MATNITGLENCQNFDINQIVVMLKEFMEESDKEPVLPSAEVGFIRKELGDSPPDDPHDLDYVMKLIKEKLFPSAGSMNHPDYHAYFPAGQSLIGQLPAIIHNSVGSMFLDRKLSPTLWELEILMCDWFAQAVGLPDKFMFKSKQGGGNIYGSATEGLLMAVVAARSNKREITDKIIRAHEFVVYTSTEGHSSVDKVSKILDMDVKRIKTDSSGSMDAEHLLEQVNKDKEQGLVPLVCVATLGATLTLAFDDCVKIGQICKSEGLWFHIDGAYAGNFGICPEYRYLLRGMEFADSLVISPYKVSLSPPMCASILWMADISLNVRYMQDSNTNFETIYNIGDLQATGNFSFNNHQIGTGKTSRGLYLWMSFMMEGVKGIEERLKRCVAMTEFFESLVTSDDRFEITRRACLGLVCFRLKEGNDATQELHDSLMKDRRIFVLSVLTEGQRSIRYTSSFTTKQEDAKKAWEIIQDLSSIVLKRV